MTEDDLLEIETRLEIKLPARYRELHRLHTDRLQRLDWGGEAMTALYLTARHLVFPNLEERREDMGGSGAFPDWWKTFVLIGTNGGGDYYCLRLDNADGVWMIGSDCGDTPTLEAATLLGYVDRVINEHEQGRAEELERVRKQAPFQPEIDAWLAALPNDPESPAVQWMTYQAIYPMLELLRQMPQMPSPRKMRLYGLELCRLISDLEADQDCAAGISLAKAMTFGAAAEKEVSEMRSRLRKKIETLQRNYRTMDGDQYRNLLWRAKAAYYFFQKDEDYLSNSVYPEEPDLASVYDAVGYVVSWGGYGVESAPPLLREVFGNPFHPVAVPPQCCTPEVVKLARTVFDEERFDRLPELGTALAGAGCNDERILAHCRRPHDHCRGCWVVDALLGLE